MYFAEDFLNSGLIFFMHVFERATIGVPNYNWKAI